jgi:hypothetical protein
MDDDRNVPNFGVAPVVDGLRGEAVILDGRDPDPVVRFQRRKHSFHHS